MGTNWTVDSSGNSTGNTYTATSTTAAGKPLTQLTTTAIGNIGSPSAAMIVYNSTSNLIEYYNGSGWQTIQSVSGLGTMAFENSNNVSITGGTANFGTAGAVPASAALSVSSTTLGFLPPVMTTTQRNAISSPATGLIVYDSSLNQWMGYDASAWVILG